MLLRISHPPTHLEERAYIFDVLFRQFLGVSFIAEANGQKEVRITMDGDEQKKELLLADVFFSHSETDWLSPDTLPEQPLVLWDVGSSPVDAPLVNRRLPVIYGRQNPGGSFVVVEEASVYLGVDIAGSAFFMLTRYEEAVKGERDKRGRFPAAASLAFQERFLDRPIVNEYVEILWWGMKKLWPGLHRTPREFQVMVSHDVDWPLGIVRSHLKKVIKNTAGDLIHRKCISLALRRLRSFIEVKRGNKDADVNNTFDWIMNESEKLGLKSAFYFIAGRTGGDIDGNYDLADPWIRRLLRHIHERGHEIGLHPSYDTYRDKEQIRREFLRLRNVLEAEKIVQETVGGRQHYLRWEAPVTWQNWDDAGLAYDSTLSYADHAGFRCGTCYEYPVFNVQSRKALKLRERPLIAMEGTLLEYMNLNREKAAEAMLSLKRRCKLFQGNFTLLWHNNMLIHPADAVLYRSVLQS